MKKTHLIVFLVTIIGVHLASLILPWWIFALVTFLVVLLSGLETKEGWWIGFLAVFFLWLVYAIWLNSKNSFILNNQIGSLFGDIPGWLLLVISALLAGIISGLAGFLGSAMRRIILS